MVLGEQRDRRLVRGATRRRGRQPSVVPERRSATPERSAHLPSVQHEPGATRFQGGHLRH